MRGPKAALITLLIMAPAVPELLTGSTPFWAFLNPLYLGMLMAVYGVPALLYREYVVGHGLPYHRLLLLGLAQGILIEGIAVNTFYTDSVPRLGVFAYYGRVLGINWPWSFYITMFHSLWSVCVPVLLTEAIYPEIHGSPLVQLTGRRTALLAAVTALAVLLFQLSEDTYHPNPLYQLMSLTAMLIIIKEAGSSRATGPLSVLKVLVYPGRGYMLVLFPFIFITTEFFILPKVLPPAVHVLIGVLTYYSLYNRLATLGTAESFKAATYLALGLALNGVLLAFLSNEYYIVPSSVLFIVLLVILYKRLAGPADSAAHPTVKPSPSP